MKYLAILLFISSSVVSGQSAESDTERLLFTGHGTTINEALLRAVCAFSMSENVSVYQSLPLSLDNETKNIDGVYASFTEMTSEYDRLLDGVSIKVRCTESVTSICIDDKELCQKNERIISKSSRFNIQRLSAESNSTITYVEKIIVAPGDEVLLDVNMLKHPVEKKHCDMNCMIMSLHNAGVSVSNLDMTGEKRPGISLSVSLNEDNYLNASVNGKTLWQQFKTQKGQEELAAAIANMPDQPPAHTNADKKYNQKTQNTSKSQEAIEELRNDFKSLEKDAAKKFDYL